MKKQEIVFGHNNKRLMLFKMEKEIEESTVANVRYGFNPKEKFTKLEFEEYKMNREWFKTELTPNTEKRYFKYGNYVFEEGRIKSADGKILYEEYNLMTLEKYKC